jgi:hypothetical protein
MWPFGKKLKLPGIEQKSNGEIEFTLTDEEEAEVNDFNKMLQESGQELVAGDLLLHPDAVKAMTAWALGGYARRQVKLAEESVAGKLRLNKALAATMKAYSLHPLPIYMFDMGCVHALLGNTTLERNAFKIFLDSQATVKPSRLDSIVMTQRNIDAAIQTAHERLGG